MQLSTININVYPWDHRHGELSTAQLHPRSVEQFNREDRGNRLTMGCHRVVHNPTDHSNHWVVYRIPTRRSAP